MKIDTSWHEEANSHALEATFAQFKQWIRRGSFGGKPIWVTPEMAEFALGYFAEHDGGDPLQRSLSPN